MDLAWMLNFNSRSIIFYLIVLWVGYKIVQKYMKHKKSSSSDEDTPSEDDSPDEDDDNDEDENGEEYEEKDKELQVNLYGNNSEYALIRDYGTGWKPIMNKVVELDKQNYRVVGVFSSGKQADIIMRKKED